jgi:hypothetical protein
MRGAIAAASALCVLVLVPPAQASSVGVERNCDKYYGCSSTVVFRSGEGETNRVAVKEDPAADAILVSDAGSTVSARLGCEPIDVNSARCVQYADARAGWGSLLVRLGDGSDKLDARVLTRMPVEAYDGAGDDVVVTGAQDDFIYPGPGANSIDGGPGENTVQFTDASQRIRVDLAGGTASGHSALRNISNVYAERLREAVLLGDDQPNDLRAGRRAAIAGRGGKDNLEGGTRSTLDGGGGNDYVVGDTGSRVSGGPGKDELGTNGGGPPQPRRFMCGDGSDSVESAEVRDIVRADCESVGNVLDDLPHFSHLLETPQPGQAFTRLDYGCFTGPPPPRVLRVEARLGSIYGRLLTRRVVARPTCGPRHYRLKASPALSALLRQRGRIRVVVFFREFYGRGLHPGFRYGYTTVLRSPRPSAG